MKIDNLEQGQSAQFVNHQEIELTRSIENPFARVEEQTWLIVTG